MKKIFGKLLVGAVGCVMALGINAFAANEVTINTPTVDKETGKVTISGTITGDADAPEATILVVPEGVSLVDLQDAQIKYIDQETAQNGTFSYEFVLEKGVKYTVYCGGTDVTAPKNDVIDLAAGVATGKFKVKGRVILPFESAKVDEVTVTVGTNPAVNVTADAEKTNEGTYAVEVEPGKYDVVVGRAGYLFRTYNVEIADKDSDEMVTNLIAGDVVKGEGVDLSDLSSMLGAYNSKTDDENFVEAADFDDNGTVDLVDLSGILANYNENESAYN